MLRVWDVNSGRVISWFKTKLTDASLMAINPEGSLLALTTDESRIELWAMPHGKRNWSASLKSAITFVAFSNGGVIVWLANGSRIELALVDGAQADRVPMQPK
jgi:hypothetical protein